MDPSLVVGAASVPIVIALIQILVRPFVNDSRFYPAAALGFCISWNLGIGYLFGSDLRTALIAGVVYGLAAAGTYDNLKALRGTLNQ
jgi:hypothetical protein